MLFLKNLLEQFQAIEQKQIFFWKQISKVIWESPIFVLSNI